jgi:hypothetical protein
VCGDRCRSIALIPPITTTTTPAPATSTTTTTLLKLDVWAPATVPFDPACTATCPEIARSAPLAHAGAALRVRVNPAIDDPIAQWGDCLESVLVCFEAQGTLAPCVEAAQCPPACKAHFAAQAAGAADEAARLDAFDALFLDPAAPCRPDDEGAP